MRPLLDAPAREGGFAGSRLVHARHRSFIAARAHASVARIDRAELITISRNLPVMHLLDACRRRAGRVARAAAAVRVDLADGVCGFAGPASAERAGTGAAIV